MGKSVSAAGRETLGTSILNFHRLVKTPLHFLIHVIVGVSGHDTHAGNTVSTFQPEVPDQKAALLFCGLWFL